jgi:hypothetical protein
MLSYFSVVAIGKVIQLNMLSVITRGSKISITSYYITKIHCITLATTIVIFRLSKQGCGYNLHLPRRVWLCMCGLMLLPHYARRNGRS